MTQTSGEEITAVHLVSSYLDVDVIIIRHNCTTQRSLYSVKYSKIEKAILLIIAACVLAVLLASCVKLWEENDIEIHPLPTTNLPTTQTPWEPQNTNNMP